MIKQKVINWLCDHYLGKVQYQSFFEKMNFYSHLGMFTGPQGNIQDSGEIHAFNAIQKKFSSHPILFDVGANNGEYCRMIRDNIMNQNHTIYVFDPQPKCFEHLKNQFQHEPKIKLFNIGLSNKNEEAPIFFESETSLFASVYNRETLDFKLSNKINICLETLDDFCERESVEKIDLLKLDVEGHELAVLEGAKKMIDKGSINYIQFEFGLANIDSRTYLRDFFLLLGDNYNIYRILRNGLYELNYSPSFEIFSTTNFIAELRK